MSGFEVWFDVAVIAMGLMVIVSMLLDDGDD